MHDLGYDVSDYTSVNPQFGSLEDFDRLVAQAHQREMKIILDWVPNHTSDKHSWFVESRASRDNPKRDWYLWRDGKAEQSESSDAPPETHDKQPPPNNWLSVFGGSAWQWDEKTKQFYYHSFLESQPDLNWRNLELRTAYPASWYSGLHSRLQHPLGQLGLGLEHYLLRHPSLHPALRILGPLLGQIQLPVQKGLSSGAGVGEKYSDLAVLDSSCRAAVLALDSHRFGALFEKARLINHQHPLGIAQMLQDIAAQVVSHQGCVPIIGSQQSLDSIWGLVAQILGQLPAVLAFHGPQQSFQIGQGSSVRFPPGEMGD
jgi:hypothetical protein